MKNTFHHASKKSSRIRKIWTALKQSRLGLTTMELAKRCNSTRPESDASELRANGVKVCCTYEGLSENGRKVYRYKLSTASA